MNEFLQTVLGFPTLLYSVALGVLLCYWLLAAKGLVDAFGDFHLDDLSGLFARLGLDGVPLTVILTVLAIFGWLQTYFVQLLLLSPMPPGALRTLLGASAALLALLPATVLTALTLRPLRRLILRLTQSQAPRPLLGQIATIRSASVSASHGQADFDDGGAGLILQVRDFDNISLRHGDRVVLLEFLDNEHAWRVVGEDALHRPPSSLPSDQMELMK